MNHRVLLPLLIVASMFAAGCDLEPVDPSEVMTLSGVVLDGATGRPIPGATVATVPATSQATTGFDGTYAIAGVAGGYYTLTASAPGYRPAAIEIAARSTNPPDTLRLQELFPNAGLVAYYPLDGTAVDASGHGRNGMAIGTAAIADRFGAPGSALLFDGRSSVITVAGGDDLNVPMRGDYSIVAWVRFTALQTQRPGIVARSTGGSAMRGYELRITGGKGEAEIGTSLGPVSTRTERFINDDRWHMIGVTTEQAAGLLHFCLDGDVVDVTPSSNLAGEIVLSADLLIGRSQATGATFSGAIDDVRIYRRSLAREELRLLYHERGF